MTQTWFGVGFNTIIEKSVWFKHFVVPLFCSNPFVQGVTQQLFGVGFKTIFEERNVTKPKMVWKRKTNNFAVQVNGFEYRVHSI